MPIGTYRGFHLYLYQEGVGHIKNLCMTVKHNLGYRVEIEPQSGSGNMVRLNNVISCIIPQKHAEAVKTLAKLQRRLESVKSELNQPFPQEAEFQALLKEQAEINAQLTLSDDSISVNGEDKVIEKKPAVSSSAGIAHLPAPSNRPRIRR